jgi:membrane associated rhomboid family serine protease
MSHAPVTGFGAVRASMPPVHPVQLGTSGDRLARMTGMTRMGGGAGAPLAGDDEPSQHEPMHARAPVTLVGPVHSRRLNDFALVLRALEIPHGVTSRANGYWFTVPTADAPRAIEALNEYAEEDRTWDARKPRVRERLPYPASALGLLYATAIFVFFALTGEARFDSTWFRHGVSDAFAIRQGEVWRALTGLTLHADFAHVAGNAVAGGIFLAMLARRLGAGRALFYTLVAGTLANVANALAHPMGHRSIGASTAVFAAVGLLVTTQLLHTVRHGARRWTDYAAPVVGGLALLGFLGSSPHSDLAAHGFGILAGFGVGLLTRYLIPSTSTPSRRVDWLQVGYVGLSIAMIVGSWGLAFAFPAR